MDRAGLGLLTQFVSPRLVDQVLAQTGRRQRRIRLLPARLVVYFVLASCLFTDAGYAGVIRHLADGLGLLAGGWTPPSTSALTQARRRLSAAPLLALFDRVRGGLAEPDTPGSYRFGLRLLALDGSTLDLADTPANAARFGRPRRGGYPQARIVAVLECGTRAVVDAVWDGLPASEHVLFDRLIGRLRGPGTLLLADRNFPGFARWQAAAGTGAHLLWRVRAGRTFPLPPQRMLPDGSYLSRLADPRDARRYRAAAARGRPLPGHPAAVAVRVIAYTVTVTHPDGRHHSHPYRLITTLLDHTQAPADALAACYRQRWDDETGLADLKTRQLRPRAILRSRTPDGVDQEIAAHLTVYQALRHLAYHSARTAGIDCQRISFTAVRETAARHLTRHAAPSGRTCRTATHRAYQEITSRLLPDPRRSRSYPRHVKRPVSRYPANRGDHRHPHGTTTYKIKMGVDPPTPTPTLN